MCISIAGALAARVNILLEACLCIHHTHKSHIWQFPRTNVIHLNGYDIVLAIADGERLHEVVAHIEVAEHKGRTSALCHSREEFERATDVGAATLGMKVYQFAYDIQYMLAPLLGRNILLNLVGEEDNANLVVVLYGTERQCGCNLSHHVALSLTLSAKVERTAHIDEQHHCEFALLLKHLDVWAVESCRDIPVDVPDVVAKLIFAHLAKRHSPSLEGRVVLSGKDIRAQSSRLYLYLPYFL